MLLGSLSAPCLARMKEEMMALVWGCQMGTSRAVNCFRLGGLTMVSKDENMDRDQVDKPQVSKICLF